MLFLSPIQRVIMFLMLFQILPGLSSPPVFYYQSKKVVYWKRTNSFHYAFHYQLIFSKIFLSKRWYDYVISCM